MRHQLRTAPLAALAAVCALAAPLAASLVVPAPAWAQTPPAGQPQAGQPQAGQPQAGHPPAGPADTLPPGDPVVARVNGADIRLSDVREAMQGLPPEYRSTPQQILVPLMSTSWWIARRWRSWR